MHLIKQKLSDKRGTALLVALLVMGVLIAISLALSSLVLRELKTTKEVIDSGRAFYAAESGIEVALYKLNNNLPGWETPEKNYLPFEVDEERLAVGEYRVNNTCNAYPCFDEEFEVSEEFKPPLVAYYDLLDLNETITIPLFVVREGPGGVVERVEVEDFTVEFFAKFRPLEHFRQDVKDAFNISESSAGRLYGWDIMRWKVFGISNDNGGTETISDFTALSTFNEADEDGNYQTDAAEPSWFGSVACQQGGGDRYTDEIMCNPYYSTVTQGPIEVGNQEALRLNICDNTQAREHYVYINGEVSVVDCYSIRDFLAGHRLNYLTLTNLMNPSVFRDDLSKVQTRALSQLYFRVELFGSGEQTLTGVTGGETVREFASITSNGYSGDSKQTIKVKIRRGSFMPVFNFSLYSTYIGGEEGHDVEYWYGEQE